jgi:hypothetical protein
VRAWRQVLAPVLGGAVGGLLLTFAVTAVIGAFGVATSGPHMPGWMEDVVALTWIGGGLALGYVLRLRALGLLRRRRAGRVLRVGSQANGVEAVREQVLRIEAKGARLRHAAGRDRGPYADLVRQLPELIRHAHALAERIARLAAVREQVTRGHRPQGHAPAEGAEPTAAAPAQVREEMEATAAAEHHLEELLTENQAQQHLCLTRLQRVEDLLDSAFLELTQHPAGASPIAPSEGIVQEMESELAAAREALQEVEQTA